MEHKDLIEIICHRGLWEVPEEQNTYSAFQEAFANGFGVELDVRDEGSEIVVSHDMANSKNKTLLENVFELYRSIGCERCRLALNIKADGLSEEIDKLIRDYSVLNYFTFDMSIPELIRYKLVGMNYFSRRSEFEPATILEDGAAGIWLDSFDSDWYLNSNLKDIASTGKEICIVSSELHRREHWKQWAAIRNFEYKSGTMLCTDKPFEAREYFND